MLDDHRRICMDEYTREYRKMETRYCMKHSEKPYIISCEKCTDVFCEKCVPEIWLNKQGKWGTDFG